MLFYYNLPADEYHRDFVLQFFLIENIYLFRLSKSLQETSKRQLLDWTWNIFNLFFSFCFRFFTTLNNKPIEMYNFCSDNFGPLMKFCFCL